MIEKASDKMKAAIEHLYQAYVRQLRKIAAEAVTNKD